MVNKKSVSSLAKPDGTRHQKSSREEINRDKMVDVPMGCRLKTPGLAYRPRISSSIVSNCDARPILRIAGQCVEDQWTRFSRPVTDWRIELM